MLYQANRVDEVKLIQQCEKHALHRVCSIFKMSGKNYGSRRIQRALLAEGICVGRYKVRRMMRQ